MHSADVVPTSNGWRCIPGLIVAQQHQEAAQRSGGRFLLRQLGGELASAAAAMRKRYAAGSNKTVKIRHKYDYRKVDPSITRFAG
jgi:hypothetical protein